MVHLFGINIIADSILYLEGIIFNIDSLTFLIHFVIQ